jgi:hypothetical protein
MLKPLMQSLNMPLGVALAIQGEDLDPKGADLALACAQQRGRARGEGVETCETQECEHASVARHVAQHSIAN